MNSLLTALCAASLGAAPALAGVSPESFVSSLQRVIVAEAETADGEIGSVASDKSSFALKIAGGKVMTIRVSDKTTYTLDGKASDQDSALSIGRKASVRHEDGLASKVDVSTKGLPADG